MVSSPLAKGLIERLGDQEFAMRQVTAKENSVCSITAGGA